MEQPSSESGLGFDSDAVWVVVRDSRPPAGSSESWQAAQHASTSSYTAVSAAIYYYNKITGITTAEKPEELKTDQEKFRDANLNNQSLIDAYAHNPELFLADDRVAEGYDRSGALGPDSELGEGSVGFQMLKKMGWKDTSAGLGKEEQGIVAPITVQSAMQGQGLGRSQEEDAALAAVTRERRRLDVEIDQSEETKRRRVENAEREAALQSDLKCMNREFYCDICDKQYKNVAEMSSHLSSYDHHHKKRFKEMKQSLKEKSGGGSKNDREAIRLREEKELERQLQERLKAVGKLHDSSSTVVTTDSTEAMQSGAVLQPRTAQGGAAGREGDAAIDVLEPAPVPQIRGKVSFSMGFKMKK